MSGLIRNIIVPSTVVTFPQGLVTGVCKLLNAARMTDGKVALILGKTPFHPVDSHWPDQPGDRGTLTFKSRKYNVIDCEILAVNRDSLAVVPNKEVKKSEKHAFNLVVGHIVESADDLESLIGEEVTAEVDKIYRDQLSLHHSASHLAAFALNWATREYWTKKVTELDSLGSPNFDKLAMDKSFIFPDHCEDSYRVSSASLKKKMGLQAEQIIKELPQIEGKVNAILAGWLANPSAIEISVEGEGILNDMRKWSCSVPEGVAKMPCGGTHLSHISQISSIAYSLRMGDDKILYASAQAVASKDQ